MLKQEIQIELRKSKQSKWMNPYILHIHESLMIHKDEYLYMGS